MFPGRSLEVPGDRHPREMIMARMRVQNSAYSPLHFLLFWTLFPEARFFIQRLDL